MVLEGCAKRLRLRLDEPRRFLVSFSGGPDSSVLLYVLWKLRQKYSIEIVAVHINFGLRPRQAEQEQEFVEATCKEREIPLIVHRAELENGSSNQERARDRRLKLLSKVLPDYELVEAHHADDQVETFLFRLFRGTGLHGLAGMRNPQMRKQRLVWRPFLHFRKKELLAFALQHQLAYKVDASNQEDTYDRNWIRNSLLPRVEQRFPEVRSALLHLQDQIQSEDAQFELWLNEMDEEVLESDVRSWHLDRLRERPYVLRARWVQHYFWSFFGIQLSRSSTGELAALTGRKRDFSWNAPKNYVLRASADRLVVEGPLEGRKAYKDQKISQIEMTI